MTRPHTGGAGRPASFTFLSDSYEFHAGLERPAEFLRREWKALATFGGGYVAAMLAIVLLVDSSFYYPRLETDQLLYLLKAKSLVETGRTAATEAVNTPPFAYAAMPGILRAPFLLMFDEFDAQLRGIQLMNIAMVALVGLMSAYILSWVLPPSLHSFAIAFAFGFMALSPDWLANIFVPLADGPYAALTLACVIMSALLLTSSRELSSRRASIAPFAVFFVVTSAVRFTAPLILLFVGVLAFERSRRNQQSKRSLVTAALIVAAAIVALAALNFDAITGKYADDALYFLRDGDKMAMIVNLVASAVPAQVIPVFNTGFTRLPHVDYDDPVFLSTMRNTVWSLTGALISLVSAIGLYRLRRRFLPEIVYLLAALPVLALIVPGTARYLMSYQPLLWAGFAVGVAHLTRPFHARLMSRSGRLLAMALATIAIAGVAAMRSIGTARTGAASHNALSLSHATTYIDQVGATFLRLREFLETLPRDRTLLIGGVGSYGRWTVISDLSYYDPDTALARIASERDVYELVECASPAACSSFDDWLNRRQSTLGRFGDFDFEPVFDYRTISARAVVHRVRPAKAPEKAVERR